MKVLTIFLYYSVSIIYLYYLGFTIMKIIAIINITKLKTIYAYNIMKIDIEQISFDSDTTLFTLDNSINYHIFNENSFFI